MLESFLDRLLVAFLIHQVNQVGAAVLCSLLLEVLAGCLKLPKDRMRLGWGPYKKQPYRILEVHDLHIRFVPERVDLRPEQRNTASDLNEAELNTRIVFSTLRFGRLDE